MLDSRDNRRMRSPGLYLWFSFLGLLFWICPSAAQEQPSIDEMFAAVEAHLAAVEISPSADGSTEARQPASPTLKEAPGSPASPASWQALLKEIKQRGRRDAAFQNRHGRFWALADVYERLEKFRAAEEVLRRKVLAHGDFGQDRHPIPRARDLVHHLTNNQLMTGGLAEIRYARLLVYLGKGEKIDPRLEQAREKQRRQALAFRDQYDDALAQFDRLQAALAERPAGDTQWKLVRLCAPKSNRLRHSLKWLEALHTMIEAYPDHSRVQRGDAHIEYAQALRQYRMYEKVVPVLQAISKDFPKHRSVQGLNIEWDTAETHVQQGLWHEEMGERRAALKSYFKAVQRFTEFKRDHPRDRRCISSRGPAKRRKTGGDARPALVDTRIRAVTDAIRRPGR